MKEKIKFEIEIVCPECNNKQKMITSDLDKASKTCVYCGNRFKVYNNLNKIIRKWI